MTCGATNLVDDLQSFAVGVEFSLEGLVLLQFGQQVGEVAPRLVGRRHVLLLDPVGQLGRVALELLVRLGGEQRFMSLLRLALDAIAPIDDVVASVCNPVYTMNNVTT